MSVSSFRTRTAAQEVYKCVGGNKQQVNCTICIRDDTESSSCTENFVIVGGRVTNSMRPATKEKKKIESNANSISPRTNPKIVHCFAKNVFGIKSHQVPVIFQRSEVFAAKNSNNYMAKSGELFLMLTRKVHRINDTRKSDLNEIIYVFDVKRGQQIITHNVYTKIFYCAPGAAAKSMWRDVFFHIFIFANDIGRLKSKQVHWNRLFALDSLDELRSAHTREAHICSCRRYQRQKVEQMGS